MKMIKSASTVYIFLLAVLFMLAYACSNDAGKKNEKIAEQHDKKIISKDTALCKEETIKDPNNPKPMALMMRQMADNAQQMKSLIEKGEKLDSLKFPFLRFHLVEPTD